MCLFMTGNVGNISCQKINSMNCRVLGTIEVSGGWLIRRRQVCKVCLVLAWPCMCMVHGHMCIQVIVMELLHFVANYCVYMHW